MLWIERSAIYKSDTMSSITDLCVMVQTDTADTSSQKYGLWVETNGFDQTKETLLFLHGYMSTNEVYELIMDKYKEDYNVLSVDLRGHGNSDTPETFNWGIEDFACDILQVVDSIIPRGYRVNIIASSLSTAIALQFTKSFPDRVDKLFLISPTHKFTMTLRGKVMQNLGIHTPEPMVHTFIDFINIVAPLFVINGEKKKTLKDNIEKMKAVKMETHRKILGETVANWSVDPRDIQQKTFIIAGKNDWVIPFEDSKELNDLLPRSSMLVLRKDKHFILQKRYEYICQLLDLWLEKDYKILRFKTHIGDSVFNL